MESSEGFQVACLRILHPGADNQADSFGTTYSFPNGLGISMKVEAGPSGVLSHRITIGAVGVK